MNPIKNLLNNDAFIKRIQWVIITLFIALIGFDIYLAVDKSVPDDTISRIIKNYADQGLYILSYFWGTVSINFFFPTDKPRLINKTLGSIIIMIVALMIYIFNLGSRVNLMIGPSETDIRITHAIYMLIGALLAFFLWRQPKKDT